MREERDESDGDDKDEVDDDVLVQMVNDKRAGFHRKHFNDFHFKANFHINKAKRNQFYRTMMIGK